MDVEAPGPAQVVQVRGVGYVSGERNTLMRSIRIGSRQIIQRSEDNGRTWREVEQWPLSTPLANGQSLETSHPTLFCCDADNGMALRVFYSAIEDPRFLAWDYAHSPYARTGRIYLQVSRDEGRSWSKPEQLIAKLKECDALHWLPGVTYGRNGASITSSRLLKTAKGTLVAVVNGARLFENGDILDPRADPATSNPDGPIEWQCGCLQGQWRPDGTGVDWTQGERFALPKKYSCDGADEGDVDFLPDGRLLMGIRARTYPHTGQELPSLHYYALSKDEGRTWSEALPLLYDDDSFAYSPACLINVFRSSKNGRFYLITNFADRQCVNCDPRNKLYIAELDTQTFRILKKSLTIIDQRDESEGLARFSNFRWFEDRETKDIVLYVTPTAVNGSACASNSYRYDIRLPD